MYFQLTDCFEVAASLDRCWDFFGRADNLPLITPPWLAFTIDMNPRVSEIGADTILDYRIRWLGVPIRWQTRIIDFSPPRQFIDLQIRGPYALWHHQHSFEPKETGGVECRDRVIYKLPLGWIGDGVHALIVRRQLLDIFTHRREVIARHLGPMQPLQPAPVINRL